MIGLVLAVLIALPAAALWSTRSTFAADDCVAKPGATAPQGRHWYFRLDRSAHRQCWYLGSEGTKTRAAARAEPELPLPVARPLSPPTAQLLAGAGNGALPVTAGESSPLVSGPEAALQPAAVDDGGAGARVTNQPDDNDMPLIWPVLTPVERGAAAPRLATAVGPAWLLAILAGALAFAGFTVRVNSGRSADSPVGRSGRIDQAGGGALAHSPQQRASADKPAAVTLADFIRSSNGATRRSHFAGPPLRSWSSDHYVQAGRIRRQAAGVS
jgi:hypothetical protein